MSQQKSSKADSFNWKIEDYDRLWFRKKSFTVAQLEKNPLFVLSNSCLHLCERGEDSDYWSSLRTQWPSTSRSLPLPPIAFQEANLSVFALHSAFGRLPGKHGEVLFILSWSRRLPFCKPVSDYAVALHCIKESTYNQIIDDNLHEYVEIMILIYIYYSYDIKTHYAPYSSLWENFHITPLLLATSPLGCCHDLAGTLKLKPHSILLLATRTIWQPQNEWDN